MSEEKPVTPTWLRPEELEVYAKRSGGGYDTFSTLPTKELAALVRMARDALALRTATSDHVRRCSRDPCTLCQILAALEARQPR